jgi:hypothetical protein
MKTLQQTSVVAVLLESKQKGSDGEAIIKPQFPNFQRAPSWQSEA